MTDVVLYVIALASLAGLIVSAVRGEIRERRIAARRRERGY
jgi:hypothetical protein